MTLSAVSAGFLKVEGAVAQPGALEAAQSMRLRDAVKLAGGATDQANLKRVRVIRANGIESVHDLTKLGPTPVVEPGDSIVVEAIDMKSQIVVRGAVRSPGAIDYKPGMTVQDALKEAEPYEGLRVDSVSVVKEINGITSTEEVSMKDIHAVALQPGESVVVAYQRSSFSDREIITILAIAILILILVRK
jgi:protein involved in polysaccharide export with SLBB domain